MQLNVIEVPYGKKTMRLTNCSGLIWNLKCKSLITITNYLNYFKVVTTLLQGGNLVTRWITLQIHGVFKLVATL